MVAVRASGVYDVIKDGYNGFKVAESTDDWAGMVAKLLDGHQQLSILSENCLEFAGNYSVEKIPEKVSSLYRRIRVLHQSEKVDLKTFSSLPSSSFLHPDLLDFRLNSVVSIDCLADVNLQTDA